MKRALLVFLFAGAIFLVLGAPFALAAEEKAASKKQTNDSMCWTVEECKERIANSTAPGTGEQYVWNDNLFVEKPGGCTLAKTGYCYAPIASYKLLIPLGEVTRVQGVGGYVQAVYALAIVLAAIGSVLTIMIAGLRWMVARGDAGAVGAAKQMITKGIMSVIILLGVVTMANLVDPSLTLLNPFRTPLVKQVNFIPPGSTCEVLTNQYKFKVATDSGSKAECGGTGKISGLPEEETKGGASVIGAKEGDVCYYAKCAKSGESCVKRTNQNKYECMACAQYVEKTEQTASVSACAQFGRGMTLTEGQNYQCTYFPPESYFSTIVEWAGVANYGYCSEIAYPVEDPAVLDCSRMRTNTLGCAAYDEVLLTKSQTWTGAGNWFPTLRNAANVTDRGLELFKSLCGAPDKCTVTPEGCKVVNRRLYVGDENDYHCVSASAPAEVAPTRERPEVGPRY